MRAGRHPGRGRSRRAAIAAALAVSLISVAWASHRSPAEGTVPDAPAATPEDWPQWRGIHRDGVSPETGLLESWPEGGPPLAWRAEGIGSGFSSVSVVDGRVFTMGDRDGRQWIIALDEEDGAELWSTEVGPPWVDGYGGPRGTPTIDGDRAYAIGTEGDLLCVDVADGSVLWRRSLTGDFGGAMAAGQGVHWKYAESPLVDGDRLLVTPGAADAMIVALDKTSGEEIWRAAVPSLGELGADGAGYSSMVVSEAAGVRQYVQVVGRGAIGVEAETGRFLWGYNRIANDVANIPTPIVDGDRVVVTTGYNTGAALLRLVPDGDGGVEVRAEWFLDGSTLQNHHGGLVLLDGVLYTGTGHNRGFPIAVHVDDGSVAWGPVRNDGEGSAAITYADGHLYLRYQSGIAVLIEANPEEYVEKGSFPIPDAGEFSWSHPVIANGRLYLREQGHLLAYDVRTGSRP